MGLGAAEAQHVDVLAGDRADDVRTGDEHPALGAEDHDVGERGTVGRAASGRAEDHRDLRDDAGRARHDGEDLADRVQGGDALAQARPAGVPDADDRDSVGQRAGIGRQDHLAARGAHGPALDGGSEAEGGGDRPVDAAGAGEHPAVVLGRDRGERAGVEEGLHAGARVPRGSRLDRRGGCPSDGHEVAPEAEATLCPPKPKELLRAAMSPAGSGREARRLTHSRGCTSSSGSVEVDGRRGQPVVAARARVAIDSTAPAAPSR